MFKAQTEMRNPSSQYLDQMSILEMAVLINEEDGGVAEVIHQELDAIIALIETVVAQMKKGGRLFYIGAGTSGRLGVMDAAECVPTFNISPDLVQGVIAGGNQAFLKAVEGAEDSAELGKNSLIEKGLTANDVVIGITASGRTPYVIGALTYANEIGALTGSITNNKGSKISAIAKFPIEVVTGPEVLTGSTRLKAGTAQKLILNMISTITMVRLGKVYENLMVDVQATNLKLVERTKRIVMEATGCDYERAERVLVDSEYSIKLAIIRILSNVSLESAKELLNRSGGYVRKATQMDISGVEG